VEAFRSTLLERGSLADTGVEEAREAGRRAALLVGTGTSWREHLGRLLDVRQVMELLGVTSRQAVYDLVARRRLLGLRRQGAGMAFPAFQFDPVTGRPYAALVEVLELFGSAGVDSYTVATWLATGQDELDGRTPVSLLADPDAPTSMTAAARRTAARLSH
jgi:predicted DNA-binding transcriptional regulator AlpA